MTTTSKGTADGRTIKFEGAVQIIIMLAIGCAAGAASFTHVHNVAASHGQDGWLAWADAVVLELMSLASGLELRHRKRHGKPVTLPAVVLVVAVVLSLSAQVVEAEPSVIGWIAAALPAAGFLAMVKIALGHSIAPAPGTADEPSPPALVRGPLPRTDEIIAIADRPGVQVKRSARRSPQPETTNGAGTDIAGRNAIDVAAREAHAALTREGRPVTRDALATRLRQAGHSVSNARASDLMNR